MYENAIYICISDISKFADFQLKSDDVIRFHRVCHVIHKIFWSSLYKVNCARFHLCRICVTDFREAEAFAPHLPPKFIA